MRAAKPSKPKAPDAARRPRRLMRRPVHPRDATLGRLGWTSLVLLGRLIGPLPSRRLAALVLQRSRTLSGYYESVHRVAARRTWALTPRLVHLPESWWHVSPLVRVWRRGLVLDLDLRDNLQRTLYYTGRYVPSVTRPLRDDVRPGDVVVDVGAHMGVHALTAARRLREQGDGQVYAFEPSASSASRLERAAQQNGLDVSVIRCALGTVPGSVKLRRSTGYDATDAGVLSQYGDRHGEQVPVNVFDAWAAEVGLARLDIVKIDVEGAEPLVLAGMRGSLDRLQPRVVVIELKRTIQSAQEHRLPMFGGCSGLRATAVTPRWSSATRSTELSRALLRRTSRLAVPRGAGRDAEPASGRGRGAGSIHCSGPMKSSMTSATIVPVTDPVPPPGAAMSVQSMLRRTTFVISLMRPSSS